MLGYLEHEEWRDMSEYVVHLTELSNLRGILRELKIEGKRAFGAATNLSEIEESQRASCLSEIPLDRLQRLSRHGLFGLGFRKEFIRSLGGAPVWYLWRETPLANSFREIVRQAMLDRIVPTDEIWKITPFVDYLGSGEQWRYEFDWEREWRVAGSIKFDWKDISFLIIDGDKNCETVAASWRARLPLPVPPIFGLNWSMDQLQELFEARHLSDAA